MTTAHDAPAYRLVFVHAGRKSVAELGATPDLVEIAEWRGRVHVGGSYVIADVNTYRVERML